MNSKQAALLVSLFLWSSALAGPLKYFSSLLGFPVHLLPKALLLLFILQTFLFLRASLKQFAIVGAVAVTGFVALDHHISLGQTAFGFWALLPFVFGLLFPEVALSERIRRNLMPIFAVCVAGEILSYFTVFPWSGMNVAFGGISTMAAREWSSGSARRLAGFTTSSIDLSLMLGIFGIIFICQSKQFMSRVLVLICVSGLILATTMKTAMLAFALACLPFLTPSKVFRVAAGVVGLIFLVLGICVPFSLQSDFFGIVHLVSTSNLETLQERFLLTWPGVLNFLRYQGAGIWGIGLGGLGSANGVSSRPFEFASVDNVYLYLLGTGGLLGCLILSAFAIRLGRETFASRETQGRLTLSLLVFFAIYGFTQPLVEESVSALFFGAVLSIGRRAFRGRRSDVFDSHGYDVLRA